MKALVTGATGFVGSRLVRHLVANGHSVAAIGRASSQFGELQSVRDKIRVYTMQADGAAIEAILTGERPDIVFHLATYFVFDHSPKDLGPMIDANLLFPLRLVDAMARTGVAYLVNTGSAWQHFRDAEYDPVCLHSATKQAFEMLLAFFINTGKLRCITLKLNDTYGADDPRRKIFTLLRECSAQGRSLDMSPGEQLIDIVHVDDVASAFDLAAHRLLAGKTESAHEDYVVSSGRPLPLRQLVETYLELSGLEVAIRWGARPYREREVMVPWSRGKTLPGWKPKIAFEVGLKRIT